VAGTRRARRSRLIVVLDANVLFPLTLRDTLLRAADASFFQLRWSQLILDEVERNLVLRGGITREQAERLRSTMEAYFPEAMVTGHEPIISSMPNEAKDRHVAAAAVTSGASLIITHNLRDFRILPSPIRAQDPDEFLCGLFTREPAAFMQLLQRQTADLKRPPITLAQLLDRLGRMTPRLADAARRFGAG
jgi:hypothetical protein